MLSAFSTRRPRLAAAAVALAVVALGAVARPAVAQPSSPVEYELTFPEPHQHWMQVAITVRDGTGPVAFRMGRSSPGRYSLHEFAKNVWDVSATAPSGVPLALTHPNPHEWVVAGHDGAVTLRYRVYGDRVDGTYLAIDDTHAHMNIPATLMYVRGAERRPSRISLRQPPGERWTAVTQLMPTGDPLVFTAPNLAYLIDSPIEFGDLTVRVFTIASPRGGPPATIRVAVHHTGTEEDVDRFVRGVARIVEEEQAFFGELPAFEPGHYTFLADYLPWAHGDGMEHRNSTVLTSSASLATSVDRLLGTVAHEFFHAWNVERIRPSSLEPFDLDEANMSGDLWLAEGFTSYAESLVSVRAGLDRFEHALARWAGAINAIDAGPAATLRSAVEMSELAPFTDAASAVDRTNFENTFVSYYTYGSVLALGLDLTLRVPDSARDASTLDAFMRALWESYGKPGTDGPPGTVTRPYTQEDLRRTLAAVAGDRQLADVFLDRHVRGGQPFDWTRLFAPAGVLVRRAFPGQATLGDLAFDFSRGTAKVSAPTPFGSPAYAAGLAQDDVLQRVDGQPISSADALRAVLRDRRPGDTVRLEITRREGQTVEGRATLVENPLIELVPAERAGQRLTADQRAFRRAWLESRVPAAVGSASRP